MKYLLIAGMILLAASVASAADSTMKVAQDAFDAFHVVMHPAWHEAYPSKDYAALLATGPGFAETYVPIAKLEPPIKNRTRLARFKGYRQEMGIFVTQYADACRKNDSAMAYEILPKMHEAFEKAMESLKPGESKLIDGLMVTADVILDFHVPAENWEGMLGSTETIFTKLDHVSDSTFPPELLSSKTEVTKAFGNLRATASDMKVCVDKKDMACFRAKAARFKHQIEMVRVDFL
jgi:hypothetical protein